MADQPLADAVGRALDNTVIAMARLGGGDVAESFRCVFADDRVVFAKTHRHPPPGFFTTEAAGLEWLRAAGAVAVPTVLAVDDGDAESPPFLALEWVTEGSSHTSDEAAFGQQLAALHHSGAASFGRADRRTTGSRALPNEPCATWAEFYASQRLLPLARLASDSNALGRSTIVGVESLAGRLADIGGPAEPPARLHGDLWAGNRLVDTDGTSWLIDPAAHGGHREFDLAMMRLFGGYGDECFQAYHEQAALAEGWQQRIPLHQLAPLMVHAIKFGGGYRAATQRALVAAQAL